MSEAVAREGAKEPFSFDAPRYCDLEREMTSLSVNDDAEAWFQSDDAPGNRKVRRTPPGPSGPPIGAPGGLTSRGRGGGHDDDRDSGIDGLDRFGSSSPASESERQDVTEDLLRDDSPMVTPPRRSARLMLKNITNGDPARSALASPALKDAPASARGRRAAPFTPRCPAPTPVRGEHPSFPSPGDPEPPTPEPTLPVLLQKAQREACDGQIHRDVTVEPISAPAPDALRGSRHAMAGVHMEGHQRAEDEASRGQRSNRRGSLQGPFAFTVPDQPPSATAQGGLALGSAAPAPQAEGVRADVTPVQATQRRSSPTLRVSRRPARSVAASRARATALRPAAAGIAKQRPHLRAPSASSSPRIRASAGQATSASATPAAPAMPPLPGAPHPRTAPRTAPARPRARPVARKRVQARNSSESPRSVLLRSEPSLVSAWVRTGPPRSSSLGRPGAELTSGGPRFLAPTQAALARTRSVRRHGDEKRAALAAWRPRATVPVAFALRTDQRAAGHVAEERVTTEEAALLQAKREAEEEHRRQQALLERVTAAPRHPRAPAEHAPTVPVTPDLSTSRRAALRAADAAPPAASPYVGLAESVRRFNERGGGRAASTHASALPRPSTASPGPPRLSTEARALAARAAHERPRTTEEREVEELAARGAFRARPVPDYAALALAGQRSGVVARPPTQPREFRLRTSLRASTHAVGGAGEAGPELARPASASRASTGGHSVGVAPSGSRRAGLAFGSSVRDAGARMPESAGSAWKNQSTQLRPFHLASEQRAAARVARTGAHGDLEGKFSALQELVNRGQ